MTTTLLVSLIFAMRRSPERLRFQEPARSQAKGNRSGLRRAPAYNLIHGFPAKPAAASCIQAQGIPGASAMLPLKIPHPKGYAGSILAPGTKTCGVSDSCDISKTGLCSRFFRFYGRPARTVTNGSSSA
jgi:hypothetical protein